MMDENYFSHMPVLAAAMMMTHGPVLELGAGLGSTLMLHGLCGAKNRTIVTLESDQIWLDKFQNLAREWHKFGFVESFRQRPSYRCEWGLVFVDHGISLERGISVSELNDRVEMIVCHDTCHPHLYGYEPILSEFKYRWNYKPTNQPMTSVVSNHINVNRLFSEARI